MTLFDRLKRDLRRALDKTVDRGVRKVLSSLACPKCLTPIEPEFNSVKDGSSAVCPKCGNVFHLHIENR